ncbi:MAG TPA: LamG domain-containing protein [Candidatus Limnocylindrales bacterium]|nr:LamG domain-containing protein [Candidatus Limnocylindrales bacterium]
MRIAILPLAAACILATSSSADANLVARYSFDTGAGGNTAFETVSGFNGTLSGNASITTTGGISGGALDLSAPSPGLVNAGDVLAFIGQERFSMQAWVKTTSTSSMLVSGRHRQFITSGYWLGLNDTGDGPPAEPVGSFHFFQSDQPPFNTGDQGINDGQWHQIVAVRDTARGELRLYVDGVRKPQADSSGTIQSLVPTTAPFFIGGMLTGETPINTFTGLIDEVRIWDNALSDKDVAFFYAHPDSLNNIVCGDASGNGSLLAGDALTALRTAVGTSNCQKCVCDVNGTPGITASDALLVLRKAVGQNVNLQCEQCIAADVAGLRWEIPCMNSIGPNVCSCGNDFVDSATLLGDVNTVYDVQFRFRGVVEQKTYTGGDKDGLFLAGGTPAADPYNVYKLEISNPPSTYYLNAGTTGIERCWLLDVTHTIPIKGGATLTLEAHAIDSAEIKNRDDASQPIIPPGVPPAPDPYNGQFIQMDVISVEEAP